MKRIIYLILVCLLSSCTYQVLQVPKFDTIEEVAEWIEENIEYCYDWQSDNMSINHWQTTSETLALGTGDCDDFAILFIDIVNEQFSGDYRMELVRHDVILLHYWAIDADGNFFDYENGRMYPAERLEYKVLESYTQKEIQDILY